MEDNIKRIWQKREEEDKRMQEWQKGKVLCRLTIGLKGFESEVESISIGPDLTIKKLPLEEREKFYTRAIEGPKAKSYAQNYEFFLFYDFKIERGQILSPIPGEHLELISIFLSVFPKSFIPFNKGLLHILRDESFESAGMYHLPNNSFKSEFYTTDDLKELQYFWPIYQQWYLQSHFAIIVRRYYYSLNRYQWEDQLIDLVIALEALLLPEECQNKGAKMAKRLSRLLVNYFDRNAVVETTKLCYDIRNQVVHGGTLPVNDVYHHLIDYLRRYLKVAIHEYLKVYRFYTIPEFVSLIDNNKK